LKAAPTDHYLSDLSESDYSSYGLRLNPFPSIGIPEEVPLTTADRDEPKRKFRDALRRTIFERVSSLMVLTGEYGAGKTHLLRYFKYSVNSNVSSAKHKVLAVYIKTLGLNFRDFYLNFVDELGRDFLTGYATDRISSYVKELGDSKARKYVYGTIVAGKQDVTEIQVPDFLRGSRYLDLFQDIQRSQRDSETGRILKVILHLAHPEYAALAWRWLLGEKLGKDEMKLIGVDYTVEDDRTAMASFLSIISILVSSGYSTLVLLVDEFENLTLIPTQTRFRYMEEIRQFIDENPGKLVMVFGTTPGAYLVLTQVPSALQRRLSGTEVDLGFFTLQDIKEMISLYLALGRVQNADIEALVAKHPGTSVATYPFEEKAINAAFEKSRGLVSAVIKICRDSLEMAVDSKAATIGAKIIEEVQL
jgi:Cdc6-like AAA superfamily ATPase